MKTCVCGQAMGSSDVWEPGEYCLYGSILCCSVACADRFARESSRFQVLRNEDLREPATGKVFAHGVWVDPALDDDLDGMSRIQLTDEIMRLRSGIRNHRDSSGHDLCWFVPELWGLLPETISPRPSVPSRGEFLERCAAYRQSLDKVPAPDDRLVARPKTLWSKIKASLK